MILLIIAWSTRCACPALLAWPSCSTLAAPASVIHQWGIDSSLSGKRQNVLISSVARLSYLQGVPSCRRLAVTWMRRWKPGMVTGPVARGLPRVGGTTGVHPVFSNCGEVGIQARCRWSNRWQWRPNCNAWRVRGIARMRCCGCSMSVC